MDNWIIENFGVILKALISVFAIFVVMIIITRVAGLRTFAKMSSLDFASTIALGTILSTVIMNEGQSLLKGGVAIAAIVAFQFLFSFLIRKADIFSKLFTNSPLLLMKDGQFIEENLSSANVAKSDAIAKLREANVIQLSEVKAMIMESTGDISVLHTDDDVDLDEILLDNVRR